MKIPAPKLSIFSLLLLNFVLSFSLNAKPLTLDKVPEPLKPWVEWALFDQEKQTCTHAFNNVDSVYCAWPASLNLDLNDKQGNFSQSWEVQAPTWVRLPGNQQQWPHAVKVNNEEAIIVNQHGYASVKLPKGSHQISGNFLWDSLPESLVLPPATGLIKVSRDGKIINFPQISQQGELWLAKAPQQKNIQDALDVQVYRKVDDGHPMQVHTRLILNVSGSSRDVTFPKLQLKGFTPLKLKSQLPTRVNRQGDIHLQVRPGNWQVDLVSYQTGVIGELSAPNVAKNLPAQEVWVFKSNPALRLTEISGVPAVDSRQTRLPKEWQTLPAYLINTNDTMLIKTLQRGSEFPKPNRLTLKRVMWMDFDGKGYTTNDRIKGTMTREWRLTSRPVLQLGSATMDKNPQFITTIGNGKDRGIEVRRGQINLEAVSRYTQSLHELPVNGWKQDFQSVNTTLYLAPGWKIFSAHGADNLPNTWLQSWTLLDLFLVLIIAISIARLWRWKWGLFALLTMVIIWHEPNAPKYIWINLIVAIALLRVLPAGLAKKIVWGYRNISLLALLLIVIPFSVEQVRGGLYPQLGLYANYDSPVSPYYQHNYSSDTTADEIAPMQTESMRVERKALKKLGSVVSSAPLLQKPKYKTNVGTMVDPNANIQTGPGLPTWNWKAVNFIWNSPVNQTQTLQLNLISPRVNLILNFLRVLLLLLLIWRLLRVISINEDTDKPDKKGLFSSLTEFFKRKDKKQKELKKNLKNDLKEAQSKVSAGLMLLLPCLLILTPVDKAIAEKAIMAPLQLPAATAKSEFLSANSASFPNQQLLQTLQQRLLEKSDCLPECAQIETMRLELSEQGMNIYLKIHSAAKVAVPLPGSRNQWKPENVLINSLPAKNLNRDDSGVMWLGLTKGIHQVVLQGKLPNQPQVQLALPLLPKYVEWVGTGWSVEGIRKNNTPSRQLQLVRSQPKQTTHKSQSSTSSSSNYLPPLLSVERTLHLGLDWFVNTRVTRLSPIGSPLSMKIPLLTGESILSNAHPVKEGKVLISMSSNERQITWRSQLPTANTLSLKAMQERGIVEAWKLDISPIWHVVINGIPEVHQGNQQSAWLPEWKPWPGETVDLAISRPEGIAGRTLTIDRSILKTQVGKRLRESTLTLKIRSSRGGQHPIKIPQDAKLISVEINSELQPVKQNKHMVSLPIIPGEQSITLKWRTTGSITSKITVLPVDIGVDNVNNSIQLSLGKDRWVLFAYGPTMGPAVLFWGVLLVILIGSIILGRVKGTPLKAWQWFLLGAGLSLATPIMIVIVVGWLLALSYRPKLQHLESRWQFNTMQSLLVILTLVALGSLFIALQQGLLGFPDMQVTGNGSHSGELHWYQDRSSANLPQPWVLSVPLLAYRVLMLLWALWLAFSLISWLRMGWENFGTGGLWRKKVYFPKKKNGENIDVTG